MEGWREGEGGEGMEGEERKVEASLPKLNRCDAERSGQSATAIYSHTHTHTHAQLGEAGRGGGLDTVQK